VKGYFFHQCREYCKELKVFFYNLLAIVRDFNYTIDKQAVGAGRQAATPFGAWPGSLAPAAAGHSEGQGISPISAAHGPFIF